MEEIDTFIKWLDKNRIPEGKPQYYYPAGLNGPQPVTIDPSSWNTCIDHLKERVHKIKWVE